MLGKIPTDINPPNHLLGDLVIIWIPYANNPPNVNSNAEVKIIIPIFLISDDFKLLTILLKIKHGIIAVTTVSEMSRHVETDRIFRLAR